MFLLKYNTVFTASTDLRCILIDKDVITDLLTK